MLFQGVKKINGNSCNVHNNIYNCSDMERNDNEFEDWHKPLYKKDPESMPVKFPRPPKRFETNFLQKLDSRTRSWKILNASFTEVCADLGGQEGLSHIQQTLCERYVFLEFFLKTMEARIAAQPKNSAKLISRWIQALNSLLGLSKTLGLERRTRQIENLQSYIGKDKTKCQK